MSLKGGISERMWRPHSHTIGSICRTNSRFNQLRSGGEALLPLLQGMLNHTLCAQNDKTKGKKRLSHDFESHAPLLSCVHAETKVEPWDEVTDL